MGWMCCFSSADCSASPGAGGQQLRACTLHGAAQKRDPCNVAHALPPSRVELPRPSAGSTPCGATAAESIPAVAFTPFSNCVTLGSPKLSADPPSLQPNQIQGFQIASSQCEGCDFPSPHDDVLGSPPCTARIAASLPADLTVHHTRLDDSSSSRSMCIAAHSSATCTKAHSGATCTRAHSGATCTRAHSGVACTRVHSGACEARVWSNTSSGSSVRPVSLLSSQISRSLREISGRLDRKSQLDKYKLQQQRDQEQGVGHPRLRVCSRGGTDETLRPGSSGGGRGAVLTERAARMPLGGVQADCDTRDRTGNSSEPSADSPEAAAPPPTHVAAVAAAASFLSPVPPLWLPGCDYEVGSPAEASQVDRIHIGSTPVPRVGPGIGNWQNRSPDGPPNSPEYFMLDELIQPSGPHQDELCLSPVPSMTAPVFDFFLEPTGGSLRPHSLTQPPHKNTHYKL